MEYSRVNEREPRKSSASVGFDDKVVFMIQSIAAAVSIASVSTVTIPIPLRVLRVTIECLGVYLCITVP